MTVADLFSILLPDEPFGEQARRQNWEKAASMLYAARDETARGAYSAFLDGYTPRLETLQALLQGGVTLGLVHDLPVEDFVNAAESWRNRVKANAADFVQAARDRGETNSDAKERLKGLTFRVSHLSEVELTDALAALCCLPLFDSCKEETRSRLEGELGKRFDEKYQEFRALFAESDARSRRDSGFFPLPADQPRSWGVGHVRNRTANG